MEKFTHVDNNGNAVMVDVSDKSVTYRIAMASGEISMSQECFEQVKNHRHKKGDVLCVAQVAGIMAAKKNAELIPLCHNIPLTNVSVEFEEMESGYRAISTVKCTAVTGAEMEALTAVSVALLTVYDMCKAVDKKMIINNIHLLEKHGGKSRDFYF